MKTKTQPLFPRLSSARMLEIIRAVCPPEFVDVELAKFTATPFYRETVQGETKRGK